MPTFDDGGVMQGERQSLEHFPDRRLPGWWSRRRDRVTPIAETTMDPTLTTPDGFILMLWTVG